MFTGFADRAFPRRVRRGLHGYRRLITVGLSAALAVGGFALAAPAAAAATSTMVALTFDNNTSSQFTLGYQQALQPHGVPATFYVNSGTVGAGSARITWAQLGTLAAAGNEIGGKTVDGINLTTLTPQQQINEICTDRQNIIAHGLQPSSFAYPGGAFNATIQTEVQNCGYGNARTAGSLSPAGPTYAETLPPKTWLGLRAYAPTGQISLANLQALVTGAAAKGGWVPIVISKVCSQTQDPANYASCTTASGWIELADFNTFLTWVQNAGQSGGAPAGASFTTMGTAAAAADTIAPATAIACNGAACSTATYTSTVTVSLGAIDTGSGVASTHYTTDGTPPTQASPLYTGPFPVGATTTVQYRSWDNAGNAEAAAGSATITVGQPPDNTPPVTTIACNATACTSSGYTAPVTVTLTAADSGWGVYKTYYTTDGSTPTTSSTVYTGPFSVKSNTTVKFFSTDAANNSEQPRAQAIAFTVVVSLTFDDGLQNQYDLGFLRALKPHNLNGTFYIVSGLQNVDPEHMTWPELTALNNGGNEVGGHTLHHINLKTTTDFNTKVTEVCQDRQNLINHGFYPTSFAYPEGAYDATAQNIVRNCGYSTARAAGGIDVAGEGAGPVYAEAIPAKDLFATRTAYDPPAGNPPNVPPITLSHLKANVIAAAQQGGGWVTEVLHQVCSQTFDPANYGSCVSDWGPIELDTLNAFLDWLQNAGQPGGAPAGTVVKTVTQVINGPDTQAPITTLQCDGSPCQAGAYGGSTTIAPFGKDPGGSGVKATYYTTDGSTPTTSSPVFTQPFTINQPMTLKFFSVDNSGNTEPVQAQTVQVQPNTDPIVGAAGDIACDPASPAFNNGVGTDTDCKAAATASLLTGLDAVLPIGDDQYDCGGVSAFQQSYGPTWGVKKSITYPVPGDEDYKTSGGTDCPATAGAGYQQYYSSSGGLFGSPVPSAVNLNPATGYYSYNLGSWHIIALNTAPCGLDNPSFCAAGSAQEQWLQNDLSQNNALCTLAYFQNPRWTSNGTSGGHTDYQQFWQDLYRGGADVVLNGDSHWYERFAPLNASGVVDNAFGVREFIAGTGGAGLETPGAPRPGSQVLNATTHGVIKMTLHNGSYGWQFANDGESAFTDAGSANCHNKPPA